MNNKSFKQLLKDFTDFTSCLLTTPNPYPFQRPRENPREIGKSLKILANRMK